MQTPPPLSKIKQTAPNRPPLKAYSILWTITLYPRVKLLIFPPRANKYIRPAVLESPVWSSIHSHREIFAREPCALETDRHYMHSNKCLLCLRHADTAVLGDRCPISVPLPPRGSHRGTENRLTAAKQLSAENGLWGGGDLPPLCQLDSTECRVGYACCVCLRLCVCMPCAFNFFTPAALIKRSNLRPRRYDASITIIKMGAGLLICISLSNKLIFRLLFNYLFSNEV